MGVIQRQGFKQSIIEMSATLISALSIILIYPKAQEAYGLARFVIDSAFLVNMFILVGLTGINIKFFTDFNANLKNRKGFNSFLIISLLISNLIFIIIAIVFRDKLLGFFSDESELYQEFVVFILPLAGIISFVFILRSISQSARRIAVPAIGMNLIKISLPLLVLGIIYLDLNYQQMVYGIYGTYIAAFILLLFYLSGMGMLGFVMPEWKKVKEKLKAMSNYGLVYLLSGLGGMLAFRIDSIMIPTLLEEDPFVGNGVYAIAAFIGGAILIPTQSIRQISSPIVSESFKNDDIKHVKFLYRESSLILSIVGFFLFLNIAFSIDDLLTFIPDITQVQMAVSIVLLIAFARLFSMVGSLSSEITFYSSLYRFALYAVLVMAVVNIILNILWIPRYNIVGAAMATCTSLIAYGSFLMIIIKWKFNIQPISKEWFYVFGLFIITGLIMYFLPDPESAILAIVINVFITIILFFVPIIYFGWSDQLNEFILKIIRRIK